MHICRYRYKISHWQWLNGVLPQLRVNSFHINSSPISHCICSQIPNRHAVRRGKIFSVFLDRSRPLALQGAAVRRTNTVRDK
jgi:hypothetical protein